MTLLEMVHLFYIFHSEMSFCFFVFNPTEDFDIQGEISQSQKEAGSSSLLLAGDELTQPRVWKSWSL